MRRQILDKVFTSNPIIWTQKVSRDQSLQGCLHGIWTGQNVQEVWIGAGNETSFSGPNLCIPNHEISVGCYTPGSAPPLFFLSNYYRLFCCCLNPFHICLLASHISFVLLYFRLSTFRTYLVLKQSKIHMDHPATMIAHFCSNHDRGCSESLHLQLAITLSIIEISGQRELDVPKCPSQWIQRGAQGSLHCPLFSSRDQTDPASQQYNLVSFLYLHDLFKSLSLFVFLSLLPGCQP